jgi:tripartite motif-containing protein 2/3
MGEEVVRMTSTLVETVSINYEDFNESFLTCGTCLCTYNGAEHTPKLLPCSHTVCLHCLGRIAALACPQPPSNSSPVLGGGSGGLPGPSTPRDSPTFRCPICRELIHVPRGGVPALPPSFLVNQLLDLMASQRREVVPKCSTHSNQVRRRRAPLSFPLLCIFRLHPPLILIQVHFPLFQELLFCETCDSVFCAACVSSPHISSLQSGDHTVIPFSIAIKRMSEILLYKANECLAKVRESSFLREILLNDYKCKLIVFVSDCFP